MKILIFIGCFAALVAFSGAYELLDAHLLSWLPATWVELAQGAMAILVAASVITYGILYLYYALKNTRETG